MVAELENKKSEIVVRIRTMNGQDELSLTELRLKMPECHIREVEGDSLASEILAVTAREVIKKHIVEPLSEIPLKMVKDIATAWEGVKEPVEKLLQGRYATCPECGAAALTDAQHDGVKFICPVCESKLTWRFKADVRHANGGRYILDK